MNLSEIVNHFRTVANAMEGVGSFHFGYLSEVNEDRDREYPLIIFTPPTSKDPDIYSGRQEIYDVVIYCYDLYEQSEQVSNLLEGKWTDISKLLKQYLREVTDPQKNYNFVVVGKSVAFDRAISSHNDKLAGVKAVFQLQIATDCEDGTFNYVDFNNDFNNDFLT